MSSFLVVLPARYSSSRLPGKPLIDLGGVPMLVRSYRNAIAQVKGRGKVVAAIDDDRVAAVCSEHGVPYLMTSRKPFCGTDRCAEAAEIYGRVDYVINYQPDEPLLEDGCISTIMDAVSITDLVCCGMALLQTRDTDNRNVGKVVFDYDMNAMYLSRAAIPVNATGRYTQVCVYGFPYDDLLRFASYQPSRLERLVGIELLRWVEYGNKLRMVMVPGRRNAVDVPADVKRVRRMLKNDFPSRTKDNPN